MIINYNDFTMKRFTLFLAIVWLLSVFARSAVNDTVSVSEMKSTFFLNKGKKDSDCRKDFDWLYGFSGGGSILIYPDDVWAKPLAVESKWQAKWQGGSDYTIFNVYWSPFSKGANYESLLAQYGGEEPYGVSAKWLYGNAYVLDAAQYNCGFWVSLYKHPATVKGGILSYRKDTSKQSFFAIKADSIMRSLRWFDKDGKERVVEVINEIWLPAKEHSEAWAFSQYVNKRFPKPKKSTEQAFDLLFVTKYDGTTYFEVLNSREPNRAQRKLLDGLSKIVKSLPNNAFGCLWNADGRVFPGRFMQASYGAKGWKFVDYLYNDR